ncbi:MULTISPECIES: VOC family protein [Actinosynnema]|uniref:VOC family protein n=1 Tax=Actinosynnema TaxID=40566 RepID=UPI0020A5A5ED|nr:VOC family protein [Actinosynnema pretiosum]MCP2094517.1 Glyoxalase-like domain-containing protein [Actinosynnema pretiosum]
MAPRLQCLVIDCPDARGLARFYAAVLGGEVDRPDPRWSLDEDWATTHLPDGQVLCFQRVPDHRPPTWPEGAHPQQMHLDLTVTDLDAEEPELLRHGAVLLDRGDDERGWRVYADPAGHPFCLVVD